MQHGYTDIGMDHFALPEEDLYKAWRRGDLHRNFMGYTMQHTHVLVGLGVSSISDAGIAFAQNHKTLHDYYGSICGNELAVTKGYFLSDEDRSFRKYILDISCKGQTKFLGRDRDLLEKYTFPELKYLQEDGLIVWSREGVEVTTVGRQFIRNICRAFDLHLLRNERWQQKRLFSKAI
jgi:oxygen-independent coproporphyrinogen-3 oxidase